MFASDLSHSLLDTTGTPGRNQVSNQYVRLPGLSVHRVSGRLLPLAAPGQRVERHRRLGRSLPRLPVIVLGRVLAVRDGPAASPDAWHLVRATVQVEEVLQGQASPGSADFYFHLGGRTGDWNSLQPRERYVFFLTRDHGVLRAAWDHWRSAIPMASGIHRGLPLSPGRPLVERVSVMLLTPGGGLNPAQFVGGFARSVPFAIGHLGRWRTAKLLKQLTADPRPQIRLGACAQLTARYWGQDACWEQVDGSEPGLNGAKVSRAAERDRRARTADPDRWWSQMSAAYPPADLLDELRLLTTHKDPAIRARFCRFLKSHYPGETDCGCETPPLPRGVVQALAAVSRFRPDALQAVSFRQ